MANFVERATLMLVDKTSRPARKINRELRKLHKTLVALKKASGGMSVGGLTKATGQATKLNAQLKQAVAAKKQLLSPTTSRLNTGRANNQLDGLVRKKNSLGTTVTIRLNTGQANNQLNTLLKKKNRLAGSITMRTPTTTGRDVSVQRLTSGRVPDIDSRRTPQVLDNAARNNRMVSIRSSSWSPMRSILTDFAYNIGYQITAAVARGIKQGGVEADVAENRILSLGLSDQEKSTLLKNADDVSKNAPIFNTATSTSLLGEMLPIVDNNQEHAKILANALTPLAREMVKAGSGFDKAYDEMIDAVKMGSASGMIFNDEGQLDTRKLFDFRDTLLKAQKFQGKDFSVALARSVMANAGSMKFGLNTDALGSLLIRSEDLRQRAATGLNQLTKVLRGGGSNAAKMALGNIGLAKIEQVQVGTVGGKTRTENRVTGIVGQDLMSVDAGLWIGKYLIPALKKHGVDTGNVADLQMFADANKLGRVIAKEAFVEMITQHDQHAKERRVMQGMDVSPQALRRSTEENTMLAIERATSSIVGALGRMVEAFEGPIIRIADFITSAAKGVESFLKGGESDTENMLRGGLAVGGAGAAGVGGVMLIKKLLGAAVGGKSGGIFGGLTTSGAGLNTAATRLIAAANALSIAAGRLSGGRVGDGALIDGGKNKSKSKSGAGKTKGIGKLPRMIGGLGVLGAVVNGVAIYNDVEAATSDPNHLSKLKNRDEAANKMLINIANDISKGVNSLVGHDILKTDRKTRAEEKAFQEKEAAKPLNKMLAELTKQREQFARFDELAKRRERLGLSSVPEKHQKQYDDLVAASKKLMGEIKAHKALQVGANDFDNNKFADRAVVPNVNKMSIDSADIKAIGQPALPTPAPTRTVPSIGGAVATGQVPVPTPSPHTALFANEFDSKVQTATNSFATVFSESANVATTSFGNVINNIPTTAGAWGSAASQALAAVAPGIGQTIGATAAAAISAASVNVNVNNSGGTGKRGRVGNTSPITADGNGGGT